MKTEDRAKLFFRELNLIKDSAMRHFCLELLTAADDYFFEMPASTSGKYHPSFALGEGGLVRHTKAVVFVAMSMAEAAEYNSNIIDCIIVAAIAHDIKKKGNAGSEHTVKDHAQCAANFICDIYDKQGQSIPVRQLIMIVDAVKSHMGQWGDCKPTTPIQLLLHQADYVASRKSFSIDFEEEVKRKEDY